MASLAKPLHRWILPVSNIKLTQEFRPSADVSHRSDDPCFHESGEPQGGIEPPTCALPRRRSTPKPLRQCGAQTSERHKYSPTTPAGIVRTYTLRLAVS